MKQFKKHLSVLFAILMLFTLSGQAIAASRVDNEVKNTAKFLVQTVTEPDFGTLAGEWTVLSLARSGEPVPQGYYENYYARVEKYVKDKKGDLHSAKFTEYSRAIVALTAIGKDPRDVAGYDLVKPLSNFDNVLKQGINGPIWALIAIDSGGYELSDIGNFAAQNSRQRMIDHILSKEVKGGGWNLMGEKADPDITAMALYSLAPYRDQSKVQAAIDRGLLALSDMQLPTGGYMTMGDENSESSAQTIIALTTLGIDPSKDYRFVKSDASGQKHSVLDALLTYKAPNGGYKHVHSEAEANGMGTDQAMEALVAVKRFEEGQSPLFDMKQDTGAKKTTPSTGFTDIQGNWAEKIIADTKGYGIAQNDSQFQPEKPITRAEFAVGVVNGLNIKTNPMKTVLFKDVNSSQWFYNQVVIAYTNDIIFGRGDGNFDPNATITRQEAFSMMARTMKDQKADLSTLNQFKDQGEIAEWAKNPTSLLVEKGVVKGRPEGMQPKEQITRAEAVKLIQTLSEAK